MRGESKPMAFSALLSPPIGFVGDHFDDLAQAACFPGIRFVIRTVVRILHVGEVQRARRSDKIQQVLHWTTIGAMGKFIGETLNSKCVVDVGHRSQPSYPDMSLRRTILDAYVGQIIGKVRPTLCQFRRAALSTAAS